MKKVFIVLILVLGVAIAIAMLSTSTRQAPTANRERPSGATNLAVTQPAPRVPAHHKDAASARPMKPTLDPELFAGKIRQAYQVAKEIPDTLAQLPCYCYCDQGVGHKSLHSCYEDDHSAHCSTCVDEALMAYQLEKEQNLAPAQIRARIIEEFSR
jgi:hypothetical protein